MPAPAKPSLAPATPVVGFAAYSGAGKTTLITRVVRILDARGVRLAVIKHAHHDFDLDRPGKDSYELRKAGARQTLVGSSRRWALVTELGIEPEPDLQSLVAKLDHEHLDLVLVEGFKHTGFPKLEIRRDGAAHPPLHEQDSNIVALVAESPERETANIPVFRLNQAEKVADFIERTFLAPVTGTN